MKKDRYECFYLAIFAPDMKRLRYILAVLLSLTVVYAGAGVSIVHYCCARCETAQAVSYTHLTLPTTPYV